MTKKTSKTFTEVESIPIIARIILKDLKDKGEKITDNKIKKIIIDSFGIAIALSICRKLDNTDKK